MAPDRSNHAFFKIKEDEVAAGDIVFLPLADEIFKDLASVPSSKVRGHPALVLELFMGKEEGDSHAWLLNISSVKSSHFDKENPLHIEICDKYNSRFSASDKLPDHGEVNCRSQCQQFLSLMSGGWMPKDSYVIANQVHELPLRCLQRFISVQLSLRSCSLKLISEKAEKAISAAFLKTSLYLPPLVDSLRIQVEDAERKLAGQLCFIESRKFSFGGTTDLYCGKRFCVFSRYSSVKPETSKVFIITSEAESHNDKIRWGNSVSGPFRTRLPLKGCPPSPSLASQFVTLSVKDEINHEVSFVDSSGAMARGHSLGNFIIVFPSFPVKTSDLLAVPNCISLGRYRLSNESFHTIESVRSEMRSRKKLSKKDRISTNSGQVVVSKCSGVYDSIKSTAKEHDSKEKHPEQISEDTEPEMVRNSRIRADCDTHSAQTIDAQLRLLEESRRLICSAM